MKIFLSVNNNAEKITVPITPSEFSVDLAPKVEGFETYSTRELSLIQPNGLMSISWDGVFPINDYAYAYDNNGLYGYDYVNKIEEWIGKKLPIRLIITDTNINIATAITGFSYKVGATGDVEYSLSFQEFVFPTDTISESEEELDMATASELQAQIDVLKATIQALTNPTVYNTVADCPEWAKNSITKARAVEGLIADLDIMGLSYDDVKHFVYMDRLGLLN